jgi:hypothetical protein
MENTENMIEFLAGARTATVTFTNQKHINKIKKIYAERSSEFGYFIVNDDGSVCAKIPLKWVKINPGSVPGTRAKREMTEEQKEVLRQRLAAGRAKKAGN